MERLSGEDASWLHMESVENLMVVSGFLELGEPITLAQVEQLLRDRLLPRYGRFSWRAVDEGAPHWEPAPDFDLGAHLQAIEPEPRDDCQLAELLGKWVSLPLDRTRPLWRMQLVPHYRGGSALLFQVHHAIADGFALLHVLRALCDPEAEVTMPRAVKRSHTAGELFADLAALARIVGSPVDSRTPLKGPLHVPKKVAWSQPIPVAEVKAAARAQRSTINDLLIAAVAGALRRYLLARDLEPDVHLHAMMPVNLRARGEALAELGNRFGLVIFPLPIAVPDPLARLLEVKQRMSRYKSTPDAEVAMGLLQLMGHLPRRAERLLVSFFGAKASAVLTNVPGPRTPLTLAGSPISRILFWVPQSGNLGLGISLFSYSGQLTIGVISDAGLVPDPAQIVAHLTDELAALGVGGNPPPEQAHPAAP